MPLYEHVYLARQDASAQQVEELTAQLKGVVEGLGGSVAKTEYWGVRSLSYRLRKNRKAHFTLMNLNAPPPAINEIERLERAIRLFSERQAEIGEIGLTAFQCLLAQVIDNSGIRSYENQNDQQRAGVNDVQRSCAELEPKPSHDR